MQVSLTRENNFHAKCKKCKNDIVVGYFITFQKLKSNDNEYMDIINILLVF